MAPALTPYRRVTDAELSASEDGRRDERDELHDGETFSSAALAAFSCAVASLLPPAGSPEPPTSER
jgi:hypothetical protein